MLSVYLSLPVDIDFHKTGKGMSSPGTECRRPHQLAPPPPANALAPKKRPRSNHGLNAGFSVVHATLVAPVSQPAKSRDGSPNGSTSSSSNGQSSTSPKTNVSKMDYSPTPSKASLVTSSSSGASQKDSSPEKLDNLSNRSEDKNANDTVIKRDSQSNFSRRDSLRRSWNDHPMVLDHLGNLNKVNGDCGIMSESSDSLRDTMSEPGTLGRTSSLKSSILSRAMTPPPKPPPPNNMHSDVYNTVFALQSLRAGGDVTTNYMTKVRGVLDDHMTKRLSTPGPMKIRDGSGNGASSSCIVTTTTATCTPGMHASTLVSSDLPTSSFACCLPACLSMPWTYRERHSTRTCHYQTYYSY